MFAASTWLAVPTCFFSSGEGRAFRRRIYEAHSGHGFPCQHTVQLRIEVGNDIAHGRYVGYLMGVIAADPYGAESTGDDVDDLGVETGRLDLPPSAAEFTQPVHVVDRSYGRGPARTAEPRATAEPAHRDQRAGGEVPRISPTRRPGHRAVWRAALTLRAWPHWQACSFRGVRQHTVPACRCRFRPRHSFRPSLFEWGFRQRSPLQ